MTQDHSDESSFKPKTRNGEFVRSVSDFRHWIVAPEKLPAEAKQDSFVAESGRYHLYISHACPWANRTMIFRRLKQLEQHISVDVVHPLMGPKSWHFGDFPGSTADTVNACSTMAEVYRIADEDFSGVVTVPLLWDRKTGTAVNNESSEIIRMFNSEFNSLTDNNTDYYPTPLRDDIDSINERIYNSVNNGVYRAGFASTQEAYETALFELFDTLDWLEQHLNQRQWLVGEQATEADWRLFPTLVRFDAVYHGHFKCNLRRLIDYPNLYAYTKRLFDTDGIGDTINMQQIKHHYYASHTSINPTGIVPAGPASGFGA